MKIIPDDQLKRMIGRRVHVKSWRPQDEFIYHSTIKGKHTLTVVTTGNLCITKKPLVFLHRDEDKF
jgi:hypothetical protein